MTDRYLTIYLRDHLAAARAGLDFTRRIVDENDHNDIGARLDEFTTELDEEAESIIKAMELLDIEPSQLKIAGAWVAEKLGRLKLNGELTGYSPLSRLLELEGLAAGIQMRRGLWSTLQDARKIYPELRDLHIDRFMRRTEEQLETLDEMHRKAARTMLKTGRSRERPRR